ncbi:acylphosphatase [Methylobacterium sp. J-076]|uniref:acylphosphatase n=1 Tax=Methylobacterium sp. J-076 TaxID=2836655 RepID=UPI001FB9FF03|nr:acylphosphatase [Methylobacterium sp. J-076]MCJ2013442.1 acylphosphatase [Methylobacterium sp. J-076]
MDEVRTVSAIIRGRVQGVSYRAWTKDTATGLGLSGHVRNRSDGGVEALFSGPADAVGRMLDLCRKGPPGARVDDVAATDETGGPATQGFVVRLG